MICAYKILLNDRTAHKTIFEVFISNANLLCCRSTTEYYLNSLNTSSNLSYFQNSKTKHLKYNALLPFRISRLS